MLKSMIGCCAFLKELFAFNSPSAATTKLPENSPVNLGDWSNTFLEALPKGVTILEL